MLNDIMKNFAIVMSAVVKRADCPLRKDYVNYMYHINPI